MQARCFPGRLVHALHARPPPLCGPPAPSLLQAHARDELGIDLDVLANPLQMGCAPCLGRAGLCAINSCLPMCWQIM